MSKYLNDLILPTGDAIATFSKVAMANQMGRDMAYSDFIKQANVFKYLKNVGKGKKAISQSSILAGAKKMGYSSDDVVKAQKHMTANPNGINVKAKGQQAADGVNGLYGKTKERIFGTKRKAGKASAQGQINALPKNVNEPLAAGTNTGIPRSGGKSSMPKAEPAVAAKAPATAPAPAPAPGGGVQPPAGAGDEVGILDQAKAKGKDMYAKGKAWGSKNKRELGFAAGGAAGGGLAGAALFGGN